MAIVPSNLGYCRVHGQLVYMDYQNLDPDGKPNLEPWANHWVKFTPLPKKVTDLTNTPRPLTIATRPTTLYTNDNGIIVGDPNVANLYGWLFGSDDSDLNPAGWDYRLDFEDAFFPPAYTLAPAGGDIEIASIMNSVGNEGELVGPAQIAASAAASSASAAAASAASINRGVAGGVAGLDGAGDVINAAGVKVLPGGSGGGGGGLGSVTLTGTPSTGQVVRATGTTAATWQTLTKAMVGLTNVDDTTDLGKPISTLQAAVNSANAATVSGHTSTLSSHTASISDLNGAVSTLNGQMTTLDADMTTLEGVVGGLTAPGGATSTVFGQVKLAGDLAGVGSTAAAPKVTGLAQALTDITTLQASLASALETIAGLVTRIDTLESFGANAVIINGQTAPRVNPITGGVLHEDSIVIWKSPGGPPTNGVEGDVPLNRPAV
jgi:hypothetical protein